MLKEAHHGNRAPVVWKLMQLPQREASKLFFETNPSGLNSNLEAVVFYSCILSAWLRFFYNEL